MALTVINPAKGHTIKTYKKTSAQEIPNRVKATHQAFTIWKKFTLPQRSELMRKASQVLTGNKEEYAKTMALEMGKPIRLVVLKSKNVPGSANTMQTTFQKCCSPR